MKENKSNFEHIVSLIKSLIWPFIILVFFLSYKTEFNAIVNYLPEMIKKSSKVTVGGISIEVQNIAEISGNPELAKIIPSLSNEGIKTLLKIGTGGRHIVLSRRGDSLFNLTESINPFYELESNGLAKASYGYNKPKVSIKKFLEDYVSLNLSDLDHELNLKKIEGINLNRMKKGIKRSNTTSSKWESLDNFGIELNDEGKKAYEIIIQVVSKELSES
ncbi:hypothetical protein Q4Q34_18215 [Flavivirga abyssicola]|uniref:hypothetical protein n=1 Tax=Flavivirga abyssicola TaxID=3063533 RepID=UPI0026DFBE46|nr:hypothetical protein [Flavivirga sp. MEBiC07777]WVK13155.1 hypothetical protein Q4Q34_18215 [Flavivirga sp. MEBiC07777]